MLLRRILVIGVLVLIALLFFDGGAFIFAEAEQPYVRLAPDRNPNMIPYTGPFALIGIGSRFTLCISAESPSVLMVSPYDHRPRPSSQRVNVSPARLDAAQAGRYKECILPLLPFGGGAGSARV
jgi:hypothetical protein